MLALFFHAKRLLFLKAFLLVLKGLVLLSNFLLQHVQAVVQFIVLNLVVAKIADAHTFRVLA